MRIERLILVSLLILLPFLFFPFSFEGYQMPRWFLLRWAIVALWATINWRLWRQRPPGNHIFLPFFIYPFFAFLFFVAISLGGAVNVEAGLLALANLILGASLFFFVSNYLKESEIETFLPFLVIPTLPIALYGIFQLFGLDFVVHQGPFKGAIATFGHRNFVAEYHLILLPLLLYMAFFYPRKGWRWYGIMSLPFVYCHFILTHTRTSYLALMVSLLFLVLAAFLRWRRVQFIVLVFLFLLTSLAFWWFYTLPAGERMVGKAQRTEIKVASGSKEAEFTERAPASLQSRLLIWQATLAAFSKHPVIGLGAGNLNEVLPLYYSDTLRQKLAGKLEAGTSHNEYLQVLAEEGILGGISFALFIFFLLFFGFKTARGFLSKGRFLPLFLTAAILGLCVAGIASAPFQRPVTLFLFYLLAGFVALFGKEGCRSFVLTQNTQRVIFGVFLALVLIPACYFGWGGLLADLYGSKSYHSFRAGKRKEAVFLIKEALRYQPRSRDLLTIAGNTFLHTGDLDAAVAVYHRVTTFHPYWPQGYANLGLALLQKGSGAEAEEYLSYSLQLDPYQPLAYNTLGVLFLEQERYQEAREAFEKALALDPSFLLAKLNLQELERRLRFR